MNEHNYGMFLHPAALSNPLLASTLADVTSETPGQS
jgi:hypothetical protein